MESHGDQDHVASTTQTTIYQPLETPQTIRLIRARRCDAGGILLLDLLHFPLEDPSCPRFTAVSYVWGEKRLHPSVVIINGRKCQVLESIYPILTCMCDHLALKEELWFWIDYLCINQDDALERGAQVALMGSLYTRASRTVVWLGDDTPGMTDATSVMLRIAAWPWERGTDEAAARMRESISSDQWQALSHWMRRPWWTRVWTLQECLLPNRLVFLCGDETIERNTWYKAVINISNYSAIGLVGHDAFKNQWTRRRLIEWRGLSSTKRKQRMDAAPGMGLVAMMAYIGFYEATDDRDRIYALLGVCTDIDRTIVGVPTYDLPVEEVYIRLAVNFIRQQRNLDIVCLGAIFTREQGQLPSWVPDWRGWNDRASRPVPSMVSEPSRQHIGNFRSLDLHHGLVDHTLTYAASANLPAEYFVSGDGRRLTCRGFVIDVIDGLGLATQAASFINPDASSGHVLVQPTSKANERPSAISHTPNPDRSASILVSLVRSLSLDRAGRYLMSRANVPGYVRQLRHTAVAGRAGFHAYRHALTEWYLANESLCVQGASLSEHLNAAVPPPRRSGASRRCDLWRAAEMTVGERPWDCRLVVTEQGHVGMAPRVAEKGDVVVVLVGCSVPVTLRRLEGKEEYTVVGECFMPDFMDGEVVNSGREKRDIVLV